ncbi:MAG: hypothetical protein E6J91_12970 [Deltaproteobacteria bacterium]|nr:MAG: hypothetical protein E6J91_12970 [Deltaproteobacteria bacterium]
MGAAGSAAGDGREAGEPSTRIAAIAPAAAARPPAIAIPRPLRERRGATSTWLATPDSVVEDFCTVSGIAGGTLDGGPPAGVTVVGS